jgi:hypothetical protein
MDHTILTISLHQMIMIKTMNWLAAISQVNALMELSRTPAHGRDISMLNATTQLFIVAFKVECQSKLILTHFQIIATIKNLTHPSEALSYMKLITSLWTSMFSQDIWMPTIPAFNHFIIRNSMTRLDLILHYVIIHGHPTKHSMAVLTLNKV